MNSTEELLLASGDAMMKQTLDESAKIVTLQQRLIFYIESLSFTVNRKLHRGFTQCYQPEN